MGSNPATESSVTIVVPPLAMSGNDRESVTVMMVPGAGLGDASSDVVMVGPGDLKATPSFMSFQLREMAGRRRQAASDMSGIWVDVAQTTPGSNKLWIKIRSPDSGIIAASRQTIWEWLRNRGRTTWEPWMCLTLGYNGQTWTQQLGIPASGVLEYEITIPEPERGAVNEALWKGALSIMAGFPSEENVNNAMNASNRMCAAAPFVGTIPIDPESGRSISLSIPVAAAFSYGAIYRWPVNNRTTACFMNQIGCDAVFTDDSRETIEGASCSGGACSMERQQAGGYYQVSSSNTLALVIGITFGVVIFASMLVGGALYFRRNPDKWVSAKAWGPEKYKSLERSLKTRV